MRRAQCPFEVNAAGYIAAIATLNNLEYVMDNVRKIVEERERLFKVLASQPYLEPIPSEGNFILARVSDEEVSVQGVRAVVESHGILLRYFKPPYLGNFLRVTVGLPEHTDKLAGALEKVMMG
jgi:histidinol-phosphate aminotransferase